MKSLLYKWCAWSGANISCQVEQGLMISITMGPVTSFFLCSLDHNKERDTVESLVPFPSFTSLSQFCPPLPPPSNQINGEIRGLSFPFPCPVCPRPRKIHKLHNSPHSSFLSKEFFHLKWCQCPYDNKKPMLFHDNALPYILCWVQDFAYSLDSAMKRNHFIKCMVTTCFSYILHKCDTNVSKPH